MFSALVFKDTNNSSSRFCNCVVMSLLARINSALCFSNLGCETRKALSRTLFSKLPLVIEKFIMPALDRTNSVSSSPNSFVHIINLKLGLKSTSFPASSTIILPLFRCMVLLNKSFTIGLSSSASSSTNTPPNRNEFSKVL